ncbi:hypothetical protein K3G39_05130 [Pontibacter sp. HSC-14F20]|uniref:hypothetical protein n=1 Tax=Pontibacter sp. HSC-14F20 TaxID=2864136 RepID=UPI001C73A811|nr:hypothetical protein [Pontibacter sp. HSC-14F20]MBX0332614.1 hypothetical protein [Pontibacter sp. HSC-14F20]
MNDLLTIISNEKRSLLRGFLVVFILVLPFTFIPAIFGQRVPLETFSQLIPQKALVAALIAAGIIVLLLLNNYEKLLQKKRLYDFPAFASLQFSGAVEDYNAIVKEISTYLFGKVGNYYFRVNIINPKQQHVQIELSPLIYIGQNQELMDRLMQELHLKENLYLSRVISLPEAQLQQSDAIKDELLKLSDELSEMGVTPMTVDKNKR